MSSGLWSSSSLQPAAAAAAEGVGFLRAAVAAVEATARRRGLGETPASGGCRRRPEGLERPVGGA
jgi:hypothetical protein